MTKIFELTGLKTFTGRSTGGVVVKKGDVCRFADRYVDKIAGAFRTTNAEDQNIPYFTPVQEGTKPVKHDFSHLDGAASKQTEPAPTVEPKEAAVATPAKTQRVARRG